MGHIYRQSSTHLIGFRNAGKEAQNRFKYSITKREYG